MAKKGTEQVWVAFSTIDREKKAVRLAQELVDRKLVACVNIIPGAVSIYRWKGKVQKEKEFLLIMKTTAKKFKLLASAVKELHSYEIPELIACHCTDGHLPYLDWVRAETK